MAELERPSPTPALLVMDMQPAILKYVPAWESLVERVGALIDQARERSVPVIFVRLGFTEEQHAAVPPTNVAFSRFAAGGMFREGDEATEVVSGLRGPDDPLFIKNRMGAFSAPGLVDELRARSVDTLLLCGVSTSGVVLSTLRQAIDQDFRVLVIHDATSDPDAEVHEFLHQRVFPGHAAVIAASELEGHMAVGV